MFFALFTAALIYHQYVVKQVDQLSGIIQKFRVVLKDVRVSAAEFFEADQTAEFWINAFGDKVCRQQPTISLSSKGLCGPMGRVRRSTTKGIHAVHR